MILAYPYFVRENTFYYVYLYDKEKSIMHILSYNFNTGLFQAVFKRNVKKDGTLVLEYRPKRQPAHISEMKGVKE